MTQFEEQTFTSMFRSVELPARIAGKLLVHSMPGRYELLDRAWQQVRSENVSVIVCLAEKSEIHEKSPEYAEALHSEATPCPVIALEVPDRGAPEERDTNAADLDAPALPASS